MHNIFSDHPVNSLQVCKTYNSRSGEKLNICAKLQSRPSRARELKCGRSFGLRTGGRSRPLWSRELNLPYEKSMNRYKSRAPRGRVS